MTLHQCNGCERFCMGRFDRCGDDDEMPNHCLFDGRKLHTHDGDPRWYRVREFVRYEAVE